MRITHWEFNIERNHHTEPLCEEADVGGGRMFPITVGEVDVYGTTATLTGTITVDKMDGFPREINLAAYACEGKHKPPAVLVRVLAQSFDERGCTMTVEGHVPWGNRVDRCERRFF